MTPDKSKVKENNRHVQAKRLGWEIMGESKHPIACVLDVAWIVIIVSIVSLCCGIARAESAAPEIVLQTIAMEADDQPEIGRAMVALTLINRANKRGTTPEIEAKRPFQYSAWNGGGKWARAWLDRYYTPEARQRALIAWNEASKMAIKPEMQGIRHYHHIGVRPKWAVDHKPVLVIKDHAFYAGIA